MEVGSRRVLWAWLVVRGRRAWRISSYGRFLARKQVTTSKMEIKQKLCEESVFVANLQ